MEWIEFTDGGKFPSERRLVLVQCEEQPEKGFPPCVCVGYLRYDSDKNGYFVTPGIARGKVTHWSDCLGDDFHAPLWKRRNT